MVYAGVVCVWEGGGAALPPFSERYHPMIYMMLEEYEHRKCMQTINRPCLKTSHYSYNDMRLQIISCTPPLRISDTLMHIASDRQGDSLV